MTIQEIKRRAELIYQRQSEQNVLMQLRSFANEEGFFWHTVDAVWYGLKHEMEQDGWGGERHTLPTIEGMVKAIAGEYEPQRFTEED